MQFLQNTQKNVNAIKIFLNSDYHAKFLSYYHKHFIMNIPLAMLLDDTPNHGIPCSDVFVQLISSGLDAFLYMMMEIGGTIGLICIILGGLLRIAALTTQKKEEQDSHRFLSQFFFICAILALVPTFIFFILLVLLPNWFGLGNRSCH